MSASDRNTRIAAGATSTAVNDVYFWAAEKTFSVADMRRETVGHASADPTSAYTTRPPKADGQESTQ